MPLIVEPSGVVGEPHGGWVHWGVTTQNITQTGDVLILRKVHRVILGLLVRIMTALANLAERSADMVMSGRTHGQHAVPITFGLKVASWIDEIGRHISRMRELEPRLFVAIIGGAAGSFASLGDRAPEVQDGVAKRLSLAAMPVPSRSIVDHFAEFVCVLGLLGATCGKVGREICNLMKTEYGEVEEPVPEGTVGTSHDTALRYRHRSAVLQTIICAVAAENIRYFQPRAIHFPPSLYKYRASAGFSSAPSVLGSRSSGLLVEHTLVLAMRR